MFFVDYWLKLKFKQICITALSTEKPVLTRNKGAKEELGIDIRVRLFLIGIAKCLF